MGKITVRFRNSPAVPFAQPPTLGYEVGYKRIGVDSSPTLLSSNPAPVADQNGTIAIEVDNLAEGYNYEITVQPKCGINNYGTLLTFTKKLPKLYNLSRDASTSAGACAAAGNNQSVNNLYATATEITNGVILYKTNDVETVGALLADNGWYSDFSKAYNVNNQGVVISTVSCPPQ